MIYLDACTLLKFIKSEQETEALRAWRRAFPEGTELVTSELAQLEITRTLLRAGIDHVTYDHELTTAAADLGFPVAAPGR